MPVFGSPLRLVYRGVWSASTSYTFNDVVYYQGTSYIATGAGSGNTPNPASTFWGVLALRGGDGTNGTNGADGSPGAPGTPGTPGSNGAPGAAATVTVGSTTTGAAGSNASVTNSGSSSAAVLNFTVPAGAKGDPGDPGAAGAASTVTIGTTTTGAAGSNASVTNTGTASAAILNFTIPQGAKGDAGIQGVKGDTGNTGATGPGVAPGGTAGQVLTKNSATDYDTSWAAASGGSGTGGGLVSRAVTAATTAAAGEMILASVAANYTVTLPASPPTDTLVGVTKMDTSINTVLTVSSTANIDGATTLTMNRQYQSVIMRYTGTTWVTNSIARRGPSFIPPAGAAKTFLGKSSATDFATAWLVPNGLLTSRTLSASTTASAGELLVYSGGPASVTLPASPANDDMVGVVLNSYANIVITINGNGQTIEGEASIDVRTPFQTLLLQYIGSGGWVVRSDRRTPLVADRALSADQQITPGSSWSVSAQTGARTLTIASANLKNNDVILIRKTDASANKITITTTGTYSGFSVGLELQNSIILSTQYQYVLMQFSANNLTWNMLAQSSSVTATMATVTATYAAKVGDFVLATPTPSAFSVSLPSAPQQGATVTVRKPDFVRRSVTIVPLGTDTIDGAANVILRDKGTYTFVYDINAKWQTRSVGRYDALPELFVTQYTSGNYYDRRHASANPNVALNTTAFGSASGFTWGSGNKYYIPWFSHRPLTIDRVSYLIGSYAPAASQSVRIGIIDWGEGGSPTNSAVLFDFGVLALGTTANTFRELTLASNATLPRGWCWFALSFTNGQCGNTALVPNAGLPIGETGTPAASMTPAQQAVGGTPMYYIQAGDNAAALTTPAAAGANFPSSQVEYQNSPNIWVRAV